MGGSSSKPAEKTETTVNDDHGARIDESSGFHVLEIHSGTLGTLGILLLIALVGAWAIWYGFIRCRKPAYGPGTPGYCGPLPTHYRGEGPRDPINRLPDWFWAAQVGPCRPQQPDPMDYCRWRAERDYVSGRSERFYDNERCEDLGPSGSSGAAAKTGRGPRAPPRGGQQQQGSAGRHLKNEKADQYDDESCL